MRVEEPPAQVRVRVHRVEFAPRLRDVLLMDEQIKELELRGDVVGQLAERVVDREAPVATWGGPFDAVIDCATTLAPFDVKTLLAPNGCYVATTPRFPQVMVDTVFNLFRRGKRRVLMLKLDRDDLEALMKQVAAGTLQVVVERAYALDDAVQALSRSRAGHVRGKLVVSIE